MTVFNWGVWQIILRIRGPSIIFPIRGPSIIFPVRGSSIIFPIRGTSIIFPRHYSFVYKKQGIFIVVSVYRTPVSDTSHIQCQIFWGAVCNDFVHSQGSHVWTISFSNGRMWWSILHVHPIWSYLSSWSYTGVENSPQKCLVIKMNYFKIKKFGVTMKDVNKNIKLYRW